MRFTPYQLHLYSSSVRNIPKDASPTACAKWRLRCIPFTFKSSRQMVRTWLSCVRAWVILWRLFLRLLAMCSCNRATRMRALLRLAEPFCLQLNRFWSNFNRSRLLCKFFGLSNVRPSEHTASDLIPKSIPKAVSSCMGVAGSSWTEVSTNSDAKYLPEGVMLTVTVFTVSLKLRCNTAGMSLAFGMVSVPFLKSTRQCWGQRKVLKNQIFLFHIWANFIIFMKNNLSHL